MPSLEVEVNGVVQSAIGTTINNVITRTPDTAIFDLEDPGVVPVSGQGVRILRSDTSEVLFGGVVVGLPQRKLAKARRKYIYTVKCLDYQRLFDRRLVNNSYTRQTCKEIIEHIVANFTDPLVGFTTNNVADSPLIQKAAFSYKPCSQVLTELADIVGYDWYIDSLKDIHFFKRKTGGRMAPFNLNDSSLRSEGGKIVDKFSLRPGLFTVKE